MSAPAGPGDPVGPGDTVSKVTGPEVTGPEATGDIGPRARFAAVLGTWVALDLAQPGVLRPDGFGHVALLALVPWVLVASRPGRRAFLAEWGAAALGLMGLFAWMAWLYPWALPPMGMVPAVWVALGGVLLRRLARRHPLALAAPAAWTAAELVRWHLPVPLSYGWWRLGTFAHDIEWLAGSARVWGTWGLGWVLAAFSGWFADLWRWRALPLDGEPPRRPWVVHALGLGPLALAVIFTGLVPPPATGPGPRVLLVQSGIESRLKASGDPLELYAAAARQTHEALEDAEGRVDLVCWAETFFPWPLVEPGTVAAFRDGARPPAYTGWSLEERHFAVGTAATALVEGALLGRPTALDAANGIWRGELERLPREPWLERALSGPGLLPADTAFLTGIETWTERGGAIRQRNAVALWTPEGRLVGTAAKVHLAPVAEEGDPWARVPFVMDWVRAVGGYVPNFVADPRPGVLELPLGGDRAYRLGISVCYDNAFDDPYLDAVRPGAKAGADADLHLVVSNEGWYGRSPLMDHMLAFSRLHAISTGRSVVRACNAGISALIDPSGHLLDWVRDPRGRTKLVSGVLDAVVPVPLRDPGGRAPATPWARTARAQLVLLVLGLALLALGSRGARRPPTPTRNPDP